MKTLQIPEKNIKVLVGDQNLCSHPMVRVDKKKTDYKDFEEL